MLPHTINSVPYLQTQEVQIFTSLPWNWGFFAFLHCVQESDRARAKDGATTTGWKPAVMSEVLCTHWPKE